MKPFAKASFKVWDLYPSLPGGERGREGVQEFKPVFLVLINCRALSTPGSCEGGVGEMGKKTCEIWPWGSKEAAGTHPHDGLVALGYSGRGKQRC